MEGMQKGVEQATTFLLFLSKAIETRPFVHHEIKAAMALNKNMIVVHEVYSC
jgi:hypothetical protein